MVSSQLDSSGRKLEVFIKVVIGEGNSGDRERKPRSLAMKIPEVLLRKLLESARPQGRASRRVRRKGKGCMKRRKERRLKDRIGKGGGSLSPEAKDFTPQCVVPPLPREPEPGAEMYRAVAAKVMEEIVVVRCEEAKNVDDGGAIGAGAGATGSGKGRGSEGC